MKYMFGFLAVLLSAITVSQITQPPGGITGNLPGWSGGNGTTGQVLTSRGPSLSPTFQAGGAGGTPGGANTQIQFNNAGAFGGSAALTWDGTTFVETGAASLGNATTNPNFSFLGTGTISVGGSLTTAFDLTGRKVVVTSTSVPANGMYLPAANTLGFATNTGVKTTIGPTGLVTNLSGTVTAGTKFTATGTGCTIGTTVGGATAGTLTLATGPCTSVAITMNGATGATALNGWACSASDRTAPTVLISQSASTTTTGTLSIPAGAGTADVISFSCAGY
jgi:hypothetical protein